MKNIRQNDNGYTLLGVVMVLVILSVLGISILAVASNSIKISTGERNDQSAYYIAEAGLVEIRAEINALAMQAFEDVNETYQQITDPELKETYLLELSFEERFLKTAKAYINNYIAESQANNNFNKQYDEQFGVDNIPTATITVEPIVAVDNSYTIKSVGKLNGKSRTVSQNVTIVFGHEVDSEEIKIDGSPSLFKACANGYLNAATTSGSVKFEGDLILNKDSTLNLGGAGGITGNIYAYGNLLITNSAPVGGGIYSNGSVKITNNMQIGNDILALGNIDFSNTATVDGNVFSKSSISISNNPTIKGQLYSSSNININGQPQLTGDIVSEGIITLSNGQIKAHEIISLNNVIVKNGSYNNIRQNVAAKDLPKPAKNFDGLVDIGQLYKDSECTNLADKEFKPKIPNVTFQASLNDLPSNTELIEFKGSQTELHFDEFNYNNYNKLNIKLPNLEDNAVYALYFNSLDMKNRDIHVSGNGKLKIYVKDSLSLGKIIQEQNSKGTKRSNFDTTVYYLNDNKKPLNLSTWGGCKIEANLFVKDSNLTNNGCTVNGNIVVLGENKVTLSGNNTTNGQIFYMRDSDLIASGSVNVKGYLVAKNMSGSGNINFSTPIEQDGLNSDMFEKPSIPSSYEIHNYRAKTLLLTDHQKEE